MNQKTPDTVDFFPHSDKQEALIVSNSDLTIGATGTQWGKSSAGAIWLKIQIHKFKEPGTNFILMAPTYKIMQQSMLPYFLLVMRGCGTYHKATGEFELNDGRRVYCRTETDPDSIVGIPRVKAYWLDEAGKVGLYFHENIQARAASVGARGLYTTSPYSRNWLWRDYIKPLEAGKLTGITYIKAASWENPYHTLSSPLAREKMRMEMDPRRFDMLFGGQWGKQAGLVYDCFDDELNVCEPFRLPNGTIFYAGVDWGHTEPFVIVVRAVTPDGMHYQVSEFYKTGLTILDQIRIAKQKWGTFNIKHFFCGHERPENILLFNQNGLPASPVAEKDIQVGTDIHYQLIKTRRYKVLKGTSPYTLDEYETYHYPEPTDLKPDQDSEDQLPVGQFDHCMSANRFVTLRTYRSTQRFRPFTPQNEEERGKAETQEMRLKRLQRMKSTERLTGI
jgi:hypothetical protein